MDQLTKDLIVAQCSKEYENGMQYKQGRVKDWQATEDQYYGRVKKTFKGRFNVPIPIMSGFVDTLMSKIDEPPKLNFEQGEEADYRTCQKVQSAYEKVSKKDDADWASKDLDNKKLACFYGRAIFKCYGESDPQYKFNLFVTDVYDFYADPMGGGDLENHRFCGEDNIFKSKYDLIDGVKSGLYDSTAVYKLINEIGENTIVKNDNETQENKANRFNALGLNNKLYNFAGDGMLKFIEAGTTFHGERYYVLFHKATLSAIRIVPLKEMFKSGLWWWTSWATHRDSFNFWSKAPADDVRPIGEIIKVLANQELDNRQKNNWGQRAYDPAMFPNPAELEFRPDGLVAVTSGMSKVTAISNGIYKFETPQLQGTINLVDWLDGIVGQKSGITAASQGNADDEKVGIYYGNMQQVADRLGLYNKSYSRCHAAIGRRFVWSLFEHLNSKMAVKIIGEKGVEWDELKRKEVNPDMNIIVEGGNAQVQADEVKKKQQFEAILSLKQDPNLAPAVNKKWIAENILRNGGFSEEEIRVALDTENEGNREILAEASEAIQEIIAKKQPKLNRGATTGFQQKILDFATDNTDSDFDLFQKLVAYAEAHNDIVMENMNRKAMKARAQQGLGLPQQAPELGPSLSEQMQPTSEPAANTFGGTAQRSQMMPTAV